MRALVRPLSTLLVVLQASGCTAGIAASRLVAANQVVREARSRGAAELAPYEITLAEQYLQEAVLASAECHYRTGIDFAGIAREHAEAAITRMEGGGRDIADQGRTGDDLSDQATPPAASETLPDTPWVAPTPPPDAAPDDEPEEDDGYEDFLEDDE